QHAHFPDGAGELVQLVVVKHLTGLLRIRMHGSNRDLGEGSARDGPQLLVLITRGTGSRVRPISAGGCLAAVPVDARSACLPSGLRWSRAGGGQVAGRGRRRGAVVVGRLLQLGEKCFAGTCRSGARLRRWVLWGRGGPCGARGDRGGRRIRCAGRGLGAVRTRARSRGCGHVRVGLGGSSRLLTILEEDVDRALAARSRRPGRDESTQTATQCPTTLTHCSAPSLAPSATGSAASPLLAVAVLVPVSVSGVVSIPRRAISRAASR